MKNQRQSEKFTIVINKEIHSRIKTYCIKYDYKIKKVIADILEEYLKKITL